MPAPLTTESPQIAGGIPPMFRSSFSEGSVREAAFLRLPAPQSRCPLSGLSRTTLLELGARGLIVMKRLRKPGSLRGIVLVDRRSLEEFLRGLPSIKQKSTADAR